MSAVTEKQAARMWCPQARFTPGTGQFEGTSGWNRRMADEDHDKCIGSRCMAWRQTDNICPPRAPGEREAKPQPAGYCGLAGKP